MKRAHLHISGRVQGVFFRASTRDRARRTGVGGWVKNLRDGRVEAVFEGAEQDVQEMIDWCHSGPSSARVKNVEVEWESPEGVSGFEVRY